MTDIYYSIQNYLSVYANDYVIILFWALVLSTISMLIYKLTSPQQRLKELKVKQKEIQELMKDDDLMEEQAIPMAGKLLKVSFKRVSLTCLPAILSGIPILLMWGILSYNFDRSAPQAGDVISMNVYPAVEGVYVNNEFLAPNGEGDIAINWPSIGNLKMDDPQGHGIFDINRTKPEYFINKWQWWNVIIPSPYGYISNNADVEMIWINLPMREYLTFGPWWLRSWFVIFVLGMISFSMMIKFVFKIE
jgi:hypothetical protein